MSKDYFSVHFDDKPEIVFEVLNEDGSFTYTDISGNVIEYVQTNGYQSRNWLNVRLDWMEPFPVQETIISGTSPIITKLQFLQRFTQEERIAIREAAKTNPYVEDFLELLNAASEVNVEYQPTIDAIDALIGLGLIAAASKPDILALSGV